MSSNLHSTSNESSPLQPDAGANMDPPRSVAEQVTHEDTSSDADDIFRALPTPEEFHDARSKLFTDAEKTEAWEKMANVVKGYSDETVERWNKEIDTLLVYAGLFSAILTAFNVQSYQLLTPPPPPPSPDPVLVTLQQISAQLNSFTVKEPFVNSTMPGIFPTPHPTSTPTAPKWAVWLNALWFSSLIFSLSAASVGIMVKQWLNEYSSGLSGTSRETARMRQYRLAGLRKWRVGAIVASLPVLLQVALGLYFAGLLILLWQLNAVVAAIASVLVGMLSVFTFITTIIPSLSFAYDCCYLSPLSLAVFEAMRPIKVGILEAASFAIILCNLCYLVGLTTVLGWCGLDDHLSTFGGSCSSVMDNLETYVERSKLSWRARELSLVGKRKDSLDGDIVATAYTTSMNPVYLDEAAPCFSEMDDKQTFTCCNKIDATMKRYKTTMAVRKITSSCGWLTSQLLPAAIICQPESWRLRIFYSVLNDDTMNPPARTSASWDIPRINLELLNLTMAWIACQRRCLSDSGDSEAAYLEEDILTIMALRLKELRRHRVPLKFVTWRYIFMSLIFRTHPRRLRELRRMSPVFCVLIWLCIPGVAESENGGVEELEVATRTIRERGISLLLTTVLNLQWGQNREYISSEDRLTALRYLRRDGEPSGLLVPRVIEAMIRFASVRGSELSSAEHEWIEVLMLKRDVLLQDPDVPAHSPPHDSHATLPNEPSRASPAPDGHSDGGAARSQMIVHR